ncbi:MAG: glutathione peroxidase [Polycyclovorans sp.]|jgi:glutathione peroxidase|nr:glutathione peroxidase [Polycyclovorans sp.]MBU0790468.1 glutathione peroxidase [Gammaproteobacteria bacterium]|tara:strand:- start:13118 stop:13597 length:480 start_codon:yes stop_codon:yes gene_type:complete
MSELFKIDVHTIDGKVQSMNDYAGKVLLVVNVASRCGFTPQYEGLEALHRQYKDQGLVVMGFPCNQFAGQEPGTDSEIATFCETRFNVSFPMFAKLKVNGDDAHPLYQYLKGEKPGVLGTEAVKWNFTKFLVDRDGRVVNRYGSADKPETIAADIAALL